MSIQEKTQKSELQDKNDDSVKSIDDQNIKEKDLIEKINELPPETREELVMEMQYSGPLPMPSHLKEYENILPGAADRIFSMTEKEAAHRHEMENKAIEYAKADTVRGQIFAFVIVTSALVGGFILILNNKNVTGFVSMISALGMLVGAFIYNNKKKNNESS